MMLKIKTLLFGIAVSIFMILMFLAYIPFRLILALKDWVVSVYIIGMEMIDAIAEMVTLQTPEENHEECEDEC